MKNADHDAETSIGSNTLRSISMNIYTALVPTYLYIKQHSITKKKYFGKTTRPDPIKYLGSGVYWNRHIKKHGKQFVETIWVSDLYFDTSIVEHALHFSTENDIVESDDWANQKPENGLDGTIPGSKQTAESNSKRSSTLKGRTSSADSKISRKETCLEKYGAENPMQSQEFKDKSKSSKLERYGDENYNNPEKGKSTMIEKYGVDHNSKTQAFKDNFKATSLENWGTESPNQSTEVKNKQINSCLEKYGVKNASQYKFLSIIGTKISHPKCSISRNYPWFKQFY
jgi:hypothetical protein